ncbi:hypothetical protein [Desulfofustis glycolicus]|uniref:Uncharacterized protein n=1 Tax=Desulfofustis glycolicus DSM 9705 TaxID=1121409 RepID=A0A1M5W786_9BACT|nr:hypothetical protein [Desulfofustis glycolicus]MCB2217299.1 hypothetical protein [Desulfobulbaceae bacterium]SHH83340.1 hypothetical protein SAMN02745124_02122 [Desulfofustis glycolicus DSM 9705]
MTSEEDSDQADGRTTDDKRVTRSAADRKPSLPPSPEELQRLVSLHLGSRPERGRSSPWLTRLVSAVLAVLALLLLFALLPELGSNVR